MNMTLEAIKEAIAALPETEKVSLTSWLNRQDNLVWDREIENDFSEGGAGMALIEAWDAEIKKGQALPLEKFLDQGESSRKTG
jgi:hypothetical protein